MKIIYAACLLASFAAISTFAAPVVDGMLDSEIYGSPLAVQDTPTTFGNATNGHARVAIGGSELNAAYAHIESGVLYLFLAMNLETAGNGLNFPSGNGNTLDIFIDSFPGGQNSLRGDNADVDGGGLLRMGHLNPENDGLKFDVGFDADYYFTFRNYTQVQDFGPGTGNREVWRGRLDMATLPTSSGGTGSNLGICADSHYSSFVTTFTIGKGVKLGFRNNNTGGVKGAGDLDPSDTSDAVNVTTGLELAIPLKVLGGPGGELSPEIKICAFINSSDHGFMANQTLAPLGQPVDGYGNLGEPRTLSFAIPEIPGNQYFVISNPVDSVRSIDAALNVNGDINLSWLAVPGNQFLLESTSDLLNPDWSQVGPTLISTNAVMNIVTNSTLEQTNFRVIELEF